MRAIDADALQLAIVEEGQANKRKKYSIGDIWELTGAEIREVINSQPTIQPDNNSENPNGSDVISRQAAIGALRNYLVGKNVPCDGTLMARLIENEVINKLPSAQPEIIYCKDCVKHNKGLGNYEVHPDGSTTWIWKDSACPLVSWRDKAQGHEFDYQFCAYAERKEVTT